MTSQIPIDFTPPTERLEHFDGPEYEAKHDLRRLAGQIKRIRDLMLDGKYRTLAEIAAETGDHEASISAQLRNLKKARFGSYHVPKRRRGDPKRGIWEYRVEPQTGGTS